MQTPLAHLRARTIYTSRGALAGRPLQLAQANGVERNLNLIVSPLGRRQIRRLELHNGRLAVGGSCSPGLGRGPREPGDDWPLREGRARAAKPAGEHLERRFGAEPGTTRRRRAAGGALWRPLSRAARSPDAADAGAASPKAYQSIKWPIEHVNWWPRSRAAGLAAGPLNSSLLGLASPEQELLRGPAAAREFSPSIMPARPVSSGPVTSFCRVRLPRLCWARRRGDERGPEGAEARPVGGKMARQSGAEAGREPAKRLMTNGNEPP